MSPIMEEWPTIHPKVTMRFPEHRFKSAAGAADVSRAYRVGLREFRQCYCFAEGMGVGSSPCFADPYSSTIATPLQAGTKEPKHHSKSIPAASAATASGYLETSRSKLTRRSAISHTPGVSLPRHFR